MDSHYLERAPSIPMSPGIPLMIDSRMILRSELASQYLRHNQIREKQLASYSMSIVTILSDLNCSRRVIWEQRGRLWALVLLESANASADLCLPYLQEVNPLYLLIIRL